MVEPDPCTPSLVGPDASQLFQALVVATPPPDRAKAMRELCSQHPALASRLESLYSCWEVAARLLEPSTNAAGGQAAAAALNLDTQDLEDRYETSETVGRGGMGLVQSAYDRRLQREVAIKRPTFAPTAGHVRRFMREGLVAARLDHPAIEKRP